MDDVVLNKAATIERCVARVRQEHAGDYRNLYENLTKQDSIILNIQRACEAAIDLGMHLVRIRKLGIPQDSRDVFKLLVQAGDLDEQLGDSLQRMVGFRNIAVHDYQTLNLDIVEALINEHLDVLLQYSEGIVQRYG